MALLDIRSFARTVHPKNVNSEPQKVGTASDKNGLISPVCREVRKGLESRDLHQHMEYEKEDGCHSVCSVGSLPEPPGLSDSPPQLPHTGRGDKIRSQILPPVSVSEPMCSFIWVQL